MRAELSDDIYEYADVTIHTSDDEEDYQPILGRYNASMYMSNCLRCAI